MLGLALEIDEIFLAGNGREHDNLIASNDDVTRTELNTHAALTATHGDTS